MEFIIPLVTAFVSALAAWYSKGRFAKRLSSADADMKEADTYNELANLMQERLVKSHVKIIKLGSELATKEAENNNLTLAIQELREQLTLKNSEIYLLKQKSNKS